MKWAATAAAAGVAFGAGCPLPEAGRYFLCPRADAGYCDSSNGPLVIAGGSNSGGNSSGGSTSGGLTSGGTSTGGSSGGTEPDAGCVTLSAGFNIDPRYGLSAVYAYNGSATGKAWQRVFAIGGITPSGKPTTEVEYQDLDTTGLEWLPAGNLVTPRAYFPVVWEPNNLGLVAFGGIESANVPLTSMELFDLSGAPDSAATWTQDAGTSAPTLPPSLFPNGLYAQGAVMQNIETILTCGGVSGGTTLGSCARLVGYGFDAGPNPNGTVSDGFTWADSGWQAAPSMTSDRRDFCMAIDPTGGIYAVGGSGSANRGVATTWEFFDGSSWACPGTCPQLSLPRIDAAAAVTTCPGQTAKDTCLYVTGGHSQLGDPVGSISVEYLDLGHMDAGWQGAAGMTYPRWGHAAVTLPDGKIEVLGGISDGCMLGAVEEYDPSANSWQTAGE